MKDMTIDGTRKTPQIEFKANGELKIEGRSFIPDPRMFYQKLFEWIQELNTDTVNLEIKMDYINTSSTKLMNDFIKIIDANPKIQRKVVKWFYEEEDEDMLEIGQIFEESTLKTEFYFKEMDMAS